MSAAHAENGENARIIGGIIGGLIGGAINNGGGFPHRPPFPFPFPGGGHHRPRPRPPFPPGPGGPGPGPGPMNNLCAGTYFDNQGNSLSFNPQPNGNVWVQFNSNQNYSLSGWGSCYVNGPMQTQFQFTLQFNGANHLNSGVLYFGNDGRAYLQGQQDVGSAYYYAR